MQVISAWGAPADDLSEMDYFAEQPVVLSASRLSQPANRAPAAVTVITREMIEASGFRHLVDALRLVPGFVVGWSGGNMPAATHLGLSDAFPHWMQIMVDGRSVYNPAFGQTTWRGIPLTLDDVDRIEVVRGPNAANDGINSLLGTIHIFTRDAVATLGSLAEIAIGDAHFREINLRYGGETAAGSWRLGLLGREDERHGVALDHASDVQLSFRGDFLPGPSDALMLQAGASRGFGQGGNAGYVFNADQRTYFLSGYANLRWTRTLGEGREWSLQAHHTFNQNEEFARPPDAMSAFLAGLATPVYLDALNANFRVSGSGLQFNYLNRSSDRLRASVSGEYYLNTIYGPCFLDTDGKLDDRIMRVSGALEWNLAPEWVLHAGAMLEHHSDPEGTHFSPRLAVNWLPAPAHAFRAGISRGVSALGLYANHTDIKFVLAGTDQTFDQAVLSQALLDGGDLEPEKIDSGELGYVFSEPGWALNLDVRVFHNRIRDMIDPVPRPFVDLKDNYVDVYENNGTIRQTGLEYQLRWRPLARSWLVLSQSWVDTDDDLDGRYENAAPRHILSLLATHPVAGVDASVGYYRMGAMRWIVWPDVTSGFQHSSPHVSRVNRLDLRLARDWKTAAGRVEVALVVQALLGDEEEAFQYYDPQTFGRRGYLSLKYEFR
jgi:iron complex outermembrane receptor protein